MKIRKHQSILCIANGYNKQAGMFHSTKNRQDFYSEVFDLLAPLGFKQDANRNELAIKNDEFITVTPKSLSGFMEESTLEELKGIENHVGKHFRLGCFLSFHNGYIVSEQEFIDLINLHKSKIKSELESLHYNLPKNSTNAFFWSIDKIQQKITRNDGESRALNYITNSAIGDNLSGDALRTYKTYHVSSARALYIEIAKELQQEGVLDILQGERYVGDLSTTELLKIPYENIRSRSQH